MNYGSCGYAGKQCYSSGGGIDRPRLFFGGAQQATYGNQTVGTIVFLAGIILLVFAARV